MALPVPESVAETLACILSVPLAVVK
jgi:hypothetical protein